MSEKEKGKLHPFVGYLQPGEVLLWAYCNAPEHLTWQNGRVRVARAPDGCLTVFLKNMGLRRSRPRNPLLTAWACGVTNQRLLTRRNNVVSGKSLKKFRVPTKLIDHGHYVTLNLGRTSWQWNGLPREEAETAFAIIEQAKREAMPFYKH